MSEGNAIYRFCCRTAITAGAIYAFNKFYNIYAVRKHLLKSNPEDHFLWKDLNVYYHCQGHGTPILLLHALHPAGCSEEWSKIIGLLSVDHTVYVLDLPGCGRSDKPKLHFTNFFYVELIKDFIHTMHLDGITVVASNLTAAVAVMSAGYDKTLFKELILISPPSATSLAETPDLYSKAGMFFLNLPLLGTFIYTIVASRRNIDLAFTEKYFYNPFHDNEELVEHYFESAHIGEGKGHYFAASYFGKYLNINISHVLAKLDLPIKVIIGANTPESSQTVTEWRALNGNIDFTEIEHTKMLPHLEEPEKVLEAILR